jgi:hypothetical protein
MQHQRTKVVKMLVNNVFVNADYTAMPCPEVILNGRRTGVYQIWKVDKNQNTRHFVAKLKVPARSTRKVVIAKTLELLEARAAGR